MKFFYSTMQDLHVNIDCLINVCTFNEYMYKIGSFRFGRLLATRNSRLKQGFFEGKCVNIKMGPRKL